MLHVFVRSSCQCPCCMSMSLLHVLAHAACLYPCCMFISMLHVQDHAACPCLWYMSMSILHVHVRAACHVHVQTSHPCPCCMPCPWRPPGICASGWKWLWKYYNVVTNLPIVLPVLMSFQSDLHPGLAFKSKRKTSKTTFLREIWSDLESRNLPLVAHINLTIFSQVFFVNCLRCFNFFGMK